MDTNTAVVATSGSGMMSLKAISDRVNLVHEVLSKVMIDKTHYGTIPGCGDKKVLLKPGADLLAMTFRLVPQFSVTRTEMENGHKEYDVTCSMYAANGELLGQGVGSASTMETKYRYRTEGGTWNPNTRRKEGGKRVENTDIADCYNTVLKIAKKRAHIDATLTVTGAADLFTQDLIDDDETPDASKAPIQEPKTKTPPAPPLEKDVSKPTLGANQVKGILTDVEHIDYMKKDKDTGKESPAIRFALVVDGQKYGTFSETLADTAMALIDSPVILTFTAKGRFKNADKVEPVTE